MCPSSVETISTRISGSKRRGRFIEPDDTRRFLRLSSYVNFDARVSVSAKCYRPPPSIILPYFIMMSPMAFIISPRICIPPLIIGHIPPCMC